MSFPNPDSENNFDVHPAVKSEADEFFCFLGLHLDIEITSELIANNIMAAKVNNTNIIFAGTSEEIANVTEFIHDIRGSLRIKGENTILVETYNHLQTNPHGINFLEASLLNQIPLATIIINGKTSPIIRNALRTFANIISSVSKKPIIFTASTNEASDKVFAILKQLKHE